MTARAEADIIRKRIGSPAMINRAFWLCVLAILHSNASASHGQESIRWKPQAGDRFTLSTESKTIITTTTRRQGDDPVVETEQREEKIVRRMTIPQGAADADFFIAELTLDSIDVTSTSAGRTMHYVARRDGDTKHVEVNIKSTHAMLAGRDVKELMEKFAANLLDQRVTAQVTRDGALIGKPSIEGKLYSNLPAETPVTKSMLRAMKRLMPAEDVPAMAVAGVFQMVRDRGRSPSTAGGRLERSDVVVEAFGLHLNRKSTLTLDSVSQADGRAVATFKDSSDYFIHADRRAEVLAELIEDDLRDAKRPAKVTLSFKPASTKGQTTIHFDIDAGHPTSIVCDALKIPLTGEMEVSVAERTTKVEIEALAEISSKTTWTKE